MLRREIVMVVVLVAGLLWAGAPAQAQGGPQITLFRGTPEQITPDEAESGMAPVTLVWQTAGMRAGDRLVLQVYVLGQWHDVSLPGELLPLPPGGSLDWTMPHTLSFEPPVFRMLLRDASGAVLDETRYVIPYAFRDYSSQILAFTAPPNPLKLSALWAGVLVPVQWSVTDRAPGANLVFEQVDGGRVVNVELPRAAPWVRSSGEGAVRPVAPTDGSNQVRLRVRVVDVSSGQTLSTYGEVVIPVEIDVPTGQPPVFEVQSFTVSDDYVARGDTVTLAWQASNAAEVWVGYTDIEFSPFTRYGPPPQMDLHGSYGPLPLSGTLALTIPADYAYRGMNVYLGASVEDILRNYRTAQLQIRFTDRRQPLAVKQFAFDHEPVRRGEKLVITWDVDYTFDAADTIRIDYVGIIEGESQSPHTPQNGSFTGLAASGSLELPIPDFPPEYTGLWFTLGRDQMPDHVYDVHFVPMTP